VYNITGDQFKEICSKQSNHFIMPLFTILIVLIVTGVLLWLINTYLPMDRKIKNILNAVVVIVLVIWLLNAFGILASMKSVRV